MIRPPLPHDKWRTIATPRKNASGKVGKLRWRIVVLHVALWEPEIPPNTGNIARLCAANGVRLHLIGRLGFRLDDKTVKRAGLDYWPHVDWVQHVTFADFEASFGSGTIVPGLWAIECPAPATYTQATFHDGDCLLFGTESKGLPPGIREKYAARLLEIPMRSPHVRSLNLATSVGIVLYEALRQLHRW